MGFEPDLQACEGGWKTPDSAGLQNPSSKSLIIRIISIYVFPSSDDLVPEIPSSAYF